MLASQFVFHLELQRDKIGSFERYPFNLPAVRTLDRLVLHPRVTFFVGENGSGKSTLLEALAVAMGFNAEGGSRNFNFGTRASHSALHEALRVARGVKRPRDGWFLRAESFFNVATEIERLDEGPGGPPIIGAYGGHSLHEQSHGESFLKLLNKRFGGRSLFILDEPEAALSPQRQLDALVRLHALVRQDSQFVIATHSSMLMAYPDAWIYHFDADGIRRVDYEDTAHFRVLRDFMADPQRRLRDLLAD
ncbi:AAA family ATPase [Roseateles sp.]|uniref:AAA family ATPase n=1 Tax=Roseateles sp. TaxID=1971397 RepID=UPI0039E7348B